MHLFYPNGGSPIQKYIKKERKIWLYQENKRKREAKGEQKEVKQILNETLFKDPCLKTTLTSLVWAFTIIHFHTPSLGHDTSLIKSTQIKDWLLSFKGFSLE